MGWITDLLKELPLSAVLKERLTAKEAEFQRLTEELDRALQDNVALQEQVAQLKQILAKSKVAYVPSDEEIGILKTIADAPSGLETKDLISAVSITKTRLAYYLGELENHGFIKGSPSYGAGKFFHYLDQKGRKLLIDKGLA